MSNRLEEDELDMKIAAVTTDHGGSDPFNARANTEVYEPSSTSVVPKAGAWAMITRQIPPLERDLHVHLRVARCFWVEHESDADDEGFLGDGSYKVRCRSPWGDVSLWPYEYAVKDPLKLMELWQAGVLVFHPTNVGNSAFNNVVFYARSRGIHLADAMVMALGSITGPVGWFEPASPELAREAEEIEAAIHAPFSVHKARRAATRRRMKAAEAEP